jgi:hypothetical protein
MHDLVSDLYSRYDPHPCRESEDERRVLDAQLCLLEQQMIAIIYPHEAICGSCGISMTLTWRNPPPLSGDAIYNHPHNHCEFAGKMLKPTGLFAGVIEENNV